MKFWKNYKFDFVFLFKSPCTTILLWSIIILDFEDMNGSLFDEKNNRLWINSNDACFCHSYTDRENSSSSVLYMPDWLSLFAFWMPSPQGNKMFNQGCFIICFLKLFWAFLDVDYDCILRVYGILYLIISSYTFYITVIVSCLGFMNVYIKIKHL